MWILLFLQNSPNAVKQYTSGTFMWKHHHHHHHHHHNDYYYYHYVSIVKSTDTRKQQLEVNETRDSKELKVKSAKCLRLLPVVFVLRIWSSLHHWLPKHHLANDNVSDGQTEDNIALPLLSSCWQISKMIWWLLFMRQVDQ